MTVAELAAAVDALKPNAYTLAQKAAWVDDMEGEIWRELLLQSDGDFGGGADGGRRLLLPDSWRRLYHTYLAAMIDFSNAEYNKYANAMTAYNSAYQGFAAWYAERYAPADRPAFWASAGGAAYNDAGAVGFELPPGAAVLAAVCQVEEAFDDADCALCLGTALRPAALLDSAELTPTQTGRMGRRVLYLPETGDDSLYARCVGGAATSGAARFAVLIQQGKE